jgi:hypothetical protein
VTYLELVEAFEALAYEAGAKSFWTGARSQNGINYNAEFPWCEFFNTQPSAVLETAVQYSIGMGFYGKDEHENGTPQTLAIQSAMDALTQRFTMLLRESDDFELVERPGGAVLRTPTVRTGPKIGTGLFIDFTVNVSLSC